MDRTWIPGAARSAVTTVTVAFICATARGEVRDVQIKEVDTSTGVVTLFNYGSTDQPLSTYRICTADDNEQLRYSTGGLAGFTIEAGTEFRIHWNNDAPGTDPANEINVAALNGSHAGPLDNGPFGLAIYHATPFGTPANMADYVQWTDSLSNPANTTADARAPTASSGGLWSSTTDWVVTDPETTAITFTGDPGGDPHDSDDYETDGGELPCPGDVNGSGDVGFGDILDIIGAWGGCGSCPQDVDGNGIVGFSDILQVIAMWGECPP
ncbi:MAG: hypothetical protein GY715_08800 [Planctomycetes bacterium]|nr:hypothetical protein [Planctomycetota bacterium]